MAGLVVLVVDGVVVWGGSVVGAGKEVALWLDAADLCRCRVRAVCRRDGGLFLFLLGRVRPALRRHATADTTANRAGDDQDQEDDNDPKCPH